MKDKKLGFFRGAAQKIELLNSSRAWIYGAGVRHQTPDSLGALLFDSPMLDYTHFLLQQAANFMRSTPIDVCSLTIWCTVTEVAKYDYCLGSKEKTEIF